MESRDAELTEKILSLKKRRNAVILLLVALKKGVHGSFLTQPTAEYANG